MTHLLVPTDFSTCAGYAEAAAISIAKQINAKITFLHVLSVGMDWARLPEGKESRYPEIKSRIAQVDKNLEERIKAASEQGVNAAKALVYLEGYRSISAAILSRKHDLVVMGAHGKKEKSMAIGSNAGKILRAAKSPVLVIQKKLTGPVVFKTIAFASGLEPDTHDAFDKLLDFTAKMGAENLHFVEITTPNNFRPTGIVTEEMKKFISHHNCNTIWLHNYNHYNVEAGIIEFAHKVEADLISIANHGRTDISSLFIESIPENLVKYTNFPILSIRV